MNKMSVSIIINQPSSDCHASDSQLLDLDGDENHRLASRVCFVSLLEPSFTLMLHYYKQRTAVTHSHTSRILSAAKLPISTMLCAGRCSRKPVLEIAKCLQLSED